MGKKMRWTNLAICDECGCRQEISSAEAPHMTMEGFREVLRNLGWKFPRPGEDICPACVEKKGVESER